VILELLLMVNMTMPVSGDHTYTLEDLKPLPLRQVENKYPLKKDITGETKWQVFERMA